jgi:hypothetical protein
MWSTVCTKLLSSRGSSAGCWPVSCSPWSRRRSPVCREAHQHRTPIVAVRATDEEGVFEAINKLAVAQRDPRSSASEGIID